MIAVTFFASLLSLEPLLSFFFFGDYSVTTTFCLSTLMLLSFYSFLVLLSLLKFSTLSLANVFFCIFLSSWGAFGSNFLGKGGELTCFDTGNLCFGSISIFSLLRLCLSIFVSRSFSSRLILCYMRSMLCSLESSSDSDYYLYALYRWTYFTGRCNLWGSERLESSSSSLDKSESDLWFERS